SLYNLMVVVSDQTPPVPLMATSMVTITVELPYQRGSLSFAGYTNISGSSVSALTNDASFPRDPAFEEQITFFEASTTYDRDYGVVMRGYLLPPATGTYPFWIASRDNGELWLSTSTNPASMTRIASVSGDGNWTAPREWDKYPSQQSEPIPLVFGY